MTSLQWMSRFEPSACEHFEKHPVWEGAGLETSRILQLESGTCYLRFARLDKETRARSILASLELRAMSSEPGSSAFQGTALGMRSQEMRRFFITEQEASLGFEPAIEALKAVLEEPQQALENKEENTLEDKVVEDTEGQGVEAN